MTFSCTPIAPHVDVAVGGVEQHARGRAGRLPLVEDADLVVDELDVAQVREPLADRGPQRAVQRVDGPLPSAVRTKRCEPTQSLIVASVSTRPSARFSAITRQDSSLNSGWYSPVSRRISSSKEPSAASNWKPRCSSSLTCSTTRAAVASSRSPPAWAITVPLPESSDTSTSRALPTAAGSMCSNVDGSALTPATCMPPLCANAFLPT